MEEKKNSVAGIIKSFERGRDYHSCCKLVTIFRPLEIKSVKKEKKKKKKRETLKRRRIKTRERDRERKDQSGPLEEKIRECKAKKQKELEHQVGIRTNRRVGRGRDEERSRRDGKKNTWMDENNEKRQVARGQRGGDNRWGEWEKIDASSRKHRR